MWICLWRWIWRWIWRWLCIIFKISLKKEGDEIKTLVSITGSTGNATLITDGESFLQIDCGISYNELNQECGYELFKCKNVICSHAHSDHIAHAGDYMRHGMKVWATPETWKNGFKMRSPPNYKAFRQSEQFSIDTFLIKPFPVSHTNRDGTPCENSGFLIYSKATKEKLLWITDASYIENRFPSVDYIGIECNYIDEEDYSNIIGSVNKFVEKRRFSSHLSVKRCVQFLEAQDLSKVKEVRLIHTSKSTIKNAQKKMLQITQKQFPNINFVI